MIATTDPKARYIVDVLRAMESGTTVDIRKPSVEVIHVLKVGADEFRVCGDLPTSFPNTVRLLKSLGVEFVV